MIVDVLRLFERWRLEGVSVRKGRNGDEAWACCPFHGETRPSFSVNMRTGKWNCLSCHERGSKIENLVGKLEGLDGKGEIEHFLRYVAIKQVDEIRDDLRSIMQQRKERLAARGRKDTTCTSEWKHYRGVEHSYLGRRGFSDRIVRQHRIGYDARARAITIPVFEHGICRFLYRRAVSDQARPKYLYPEEITKSDYLWGLDLPRSTYRDQTLYVTEGALDALWLRQQGITCTAAVLGSFMSDAQARKIADLDPKEVVLFFDNDEAGYDATEHAGKLLMSYGIRAVFYIRYPRDAGNDPQTCTGRQISNMLVRRKHYNHFRLASKVGRRRRIRRLLATAQMNKEKPTHG